MSEQEREVSFDPEKFLSAALPESNATEFEVVPAGTYRAYVDNIDVRNGFVKKDGPNFGKPWVALNIRWTIEDEELAKRMGQTKVPVFHSVMLDLDDHNQIASGKGRNVRLGRLREALDLNSGPVNFLAFKGRPALIKVDHEVYEGKLQARVADVAKAM